MNIEEILIIKDGDVHYGISTEYIDQILRSTALTPVILTTKAILGLSAVSGRIVTVYDMNLLLDSKAIDIANDATRFLSLRGEFDNSAIVVGEVVESILLDEEKLEYIDNNDDGIIALYKTEKNIIQILDFSILLAKGELAPYSKKDVKDGISKHSDDSSKNLNEKRFLFVRMANERYAIELDILREIMNLPESFTEIAGSKNDILGMMPLRDELLLVSDLRRFFSFDDTINDKNRILVTEDDGKILGLVVDEILDIRDIDISRISEMPANFQDQKLSGVIHDDEQLVSLIDIDIIRQIANENVGLVSQENTHISDEQIDSVMLEVVVFKLFDEEYAINIEDVVEIIDSESITPLADAPEFVEGVINIRGQIVTIMSVYEWLGKSKSNSIEPKIIISQIGNHRIGFLVDDVSDVMGVYENEIQEEHEQNEYFSNILYLDEGSRLVLLFDINKLVETKEANA